MHGIVTPKWHELGVSPCDIPESTANFTLHCKPVPPIDIAELLRLPAADDATSEDLRRALSWLNDDRLYANVPTGQPQKTRLKRDEIRLMCDRGKCEVAQDARSFCRVFKVPEWAKTRWRVIEHPAEVNEHTTLDAKTCFLSASERHAAVLSGEHVADIDFAAFFDELELAPSVRKFFCFSSGGTLYQMKVLPMGLKHSVRVAQAVTKQLLNFDRPASVFVEPYIDNVRLVSDSVADLTATIADLLLRCAKARVTVNEVDVTPFRHHNAVPPELVSASKALIKSTHTWLGEEFDYVKKTVAMSAKTRDKLNAKAPPNATFKNLISQLSLLIYGSRTYKLKLGPFYAARRAHSAISQLLSACPELWNAPAPPLCESALLNLCAWKAAILAHPPRQVKAGERPTVYLITDACEEFGFGAYFVDEYGREHILSRPWSAEDRAAGFPRQSAYSESEAGWRAICRFVNPRKPVVMAWGTDNTQAEVALPRGQSLSYCVNNIAARLVAAFPLLEIIGCRIPGDKMPVDGLSRGAKTLTLEEWEIARAWVVEVQDKTTQPG